MNYSAIGALAVMILFIENFAILLSKGNKGNFPAWRVYRRFLFVILAYYVTDILWGILETLKLAVPLFVDTSLYFIVLSVGVLFWTRFVVTYLNDNRLYGAVLIWTGRVYCAAVCLTVGVNVFVPVLFEVDRNCVYVARTLRDWVLISQIAVMLLVSVYAFIAMARRKDAARRRYRAIGFFGLIPAVLLFVQLWFPYLPLYSLAYLLGTSLLHTFVVNDEKDEYEQKLEEGLKREKHQSEELRSAWAMAYTDPLTRVKSKLAFVETEDRKDDAILKGESAPFALAVFDLNGLKRINDQLGHERGDRYIVDACRLICTRFKHSPVFRIGGDEFAAVLEGEDYESRAELERTFNLSMDHPADGEQPVVAMGMAEYRPGEDDSFRRVFDRADRLMYQRKSQLKGESGREPFPDQIVLEI